ncbi:DsbA family protein [Thalassotalea litorea]|uniref:DsbA family protein n=1 Tax=Thalassotalea litorea TaxID=2020715 RepID=UPI0037357C52
MKIVKYHSFGFIFSFMALLVACDNNRAPDSADKVDQLLREQQRLAEQLRQLQNQVADIHEIAMKSQQPKTIELATQKNYTDNGKLPVKGSKDAKIAIIEFSDFQCPYCKRFEDETFALIDKNHIEKGQVQYVVRDYPLSFHPLAEGAAVAAGCAHQQGSYWPFRKNLFNNTAKLSEAFYIELSKTLKLNTDQFQHCLNDQVQLKRIKADMMLAKSLGISGTPSFVIGIVENGELVRPILITGAQPYRSFSLIFDEILQQP